MALTKKKAASAVAAVAVAAALALGGTFAWQSISQTALNEASDVVNPGGRLHDDFNGENKDVYVENFADEPIYARIQLSEYFEIVSNYGAGAGVEKSVQLLGGKSVDEDTDETTYAYETFTNYASLVDGAVAAGVSGAYDAAAAEGEEGYSWWTWKTGGQTVYMPTFNMNKDSLQADVNGTYVDAVGGISNRDGSQYSGYAEYAEGQTATGDEVWDADANGVEDEGVTTIAGVEHTAKLTGDATLMSMQEWIDAGSNPGPCWVYDADGWVYWAEAIQPDTATGLLLDSIELNQVMDDTWYYAINVEAQFVTADDLGAADGTGFYSDGEAPTDEALALLEAIGVDVSGAEEGGSVDEGEVVSYSIAASSAASTWQHGYVMPGESVSLKVMAEMEDGTSKEVTEGTEWQVYPRYDENGQFDVVDGVLSIPEDAGLNIVYVGCIVEGLDYLLETTVYVGAAGMTASVAFMNVEPPFIATHSYRPEIGISDGQDRELYLNADGWAVTDATGGSDVTDEVLSSEEGSYSIRFAQAGSYKVEAGSAAAFTDLDVSAATCEVIPTIASYGVSASVDGSPLTLVRPETGSAYIDARDYVYGGEIVLTLEDGQTANFSVESAAFVDESGTQSWRIEGANSVTVLLEDTESNHSRTIDGVEYYQAPVKVMNPSKPNNDFYYIDFLLSVRDPEEEE